MYIYIYINPHSPPSTIIFRNPSKETHPSQGNTKNPNYSHLYICMFFALIIYISISNILFVTLCRKIMSRPGDWTCRSCQHMNFQRRESCQRCGEMKHGGSFGGRGIGINPSTFSFTGPDVRPGDWYCNVGNCGAHNFASRSSCFKCGAFKDDLGSNGGGFDGDMSRGRGFGFGGGSGSGNGRSGWKSGDWICTRPGCNEHNFASRMECFRCNAPRDTGSHSSF
ncbi:RNA-binding protein involved in heterochromatin assembly dri1-like isoform X2 [Bidens hawaiensis]|uniref:RNA-binding protein involved in heterochromatin assembly dri1-like isoform X2 n=1 Tax=Bidens hawaiensis TaxID=980011 RepID=UPI00404B7A35